MIKKSSETIIFEFVMCNFVVQVIRALPLEEQAVLLVLVASVGQDDCLMSQMQRNELLGAVMYGMGKSQFTEAEVNEMLESIVEKGFAENKDDSGAYHALVTVDEMRDAISDAKLAAIAKVVTDPISSDTQLVSVVNALPFETQALLVVSCAAAQSSGAEPTSLWILKSMMTKFAPILGSSKRIEKMEGAASSLGPLVQQLSVAELVATDARSGTVVTKCSLKNVLMATRDKCLRVAALALGDALVDARTSNEAS